LPGRESALHTCGKIAAQTQAIEISGRRNNSPELANERVNVPARSLFAKAFSDIHRFVVESEEQPILVFLKETTDEADAIHLLRVAVVIESEHKIPPGLPHHSIPTSNGAAPRSCLRSLLRVERASE